MMLFGITSIEGLMIQLFIFGILSRAFLQDSSFAFAYWTDLFFVASLVLLFYFVAKKLRSYVKEKK